MTVTAYLGDLTGIPTVLEFLNEPWRQRAACGDEPDEELFFLELADAAYKPHLAKAGLLAPLLVCADCPVRRECLEVALSAHTYASTDDDRHGRGQRVFGVWGGKQRVRQAALQGRPGRRSGKRARGDLR